VNRIKVPTKTRSRRAADATVNAGEKIQPRSVRRLGGRRRGYPFIVRKGRPGLLGCSLTGKKFYRKGAREYLTLAS
jgi:hypothetical protein